MNAQAKSIFAKLPPDAVELLNGYALIPTECIDRLAILTDVDSNYARTRPVQLLSILLSAFNSGEITKGAFADLLYMAYLEVGEWQKGIEEVIGKAEPIGADAP